jgi:hypothetical protein
VQLLLQDAGTARGKFARHWRRAPHEIHMLLVRLIRRKSFECLPHRGEDFLRGVLAVLIHPPCGFGRRV